MEDIDDSTAVLAAADNGNGPTGIDEEVVEVDNYEKRYLNKNVMKLLKHNDPTIKKVVIDLEEGDTYANDYIDWKTEGVSAISENTHLKSLTLNILQDDWVDAIDELSARDNMRALFRSISRNRSIKHLVIQVSDEMHLISSGYIMEIISPLFQYNQLCSFEVYNFNLSPRSSDLLVSALTKCNSMTKFTLHHTHSHVWENVYDELLTEILAAAGNLKKLSLSINYCDCDGMKKWIALRDLLQSTTSKLQSLDLDENHISKEAAVLLGAALGQNSSLKKLTLFGVRPVTSSGWVAIFQGLAINSSVEEIDLDFNEPICDEAVLAFASTVTKQSSLKSVSIRHNRDGISPKSWKVLLNSILTSCSALEKLKLLKNNINDEAVFVLRDAMVNGSILKTLTLAGTLSITPAGWASFFGCLADPNTSLESLDLSDGYSDGQDTCTIDDESFGTLANALCTNTKLKRIDLSWNNSISSVGWQAFFNTLRDSNSILENLILNNINNIDDNVAVSMAAALGNTNTLKSLSLRKARSISSVGWRAFADILQSPNSNLAVLQVCDNGNLLNDEVITSFANAIAHNNKLKTLDMSVYVDDITTSNVSARSWSTIANILCNTSNICSIYNSNHTLSDIGNIGYRVRDFPTKLTDYLQLNENDNKLEVAREKIIRSHFLNGEDNMQDFVDMELGLLPHALGWTGRNNIGHSLLYRLVHSMPLLFDYESRKAKATTGMKRKMNCL